MNIPDSVLTDLFMSSLNTEMKDETVELKSEFSCINVHDCMDGMQPLFSLQFWVCFMEINSQIKVAPSAKMLTNHNGLRPTPVFLNFCETGNYCSFNLPLRCHFSVIGIL